MTLILDNLFHPSLNISPNPIANATSRWILPSCVVVLISISLHAFHVLIDFGQWLIVDFYRFYSSAVNISLMFDLVLRWSLITLFDPCLSHLFWLFPFPAFIHAEYSSLDCSFNLHLSTTLLYKLILVYWLYCRPTSPFMSIYCISDGFIINDDWLWPGHNSQ